MFSSGTKSRMLAAGMASSNTGVSGGTIIGIGAAPKLQDSTAPRLTNCGTAGSFLRPVQPSTMPDSTIGSPGVRIWVCGPVAVGQVTVA